VDPSSVLIVSDDGDFSRTVAGRWQSERSVPAFTVMSGDLCRGFEVDSFELAIVGAIRPDALSAVLEALDPASRPVIFVCRSAHSAQTMRDTCPRVLILRDYEGWWDSLVLLSTEAIRRSEAVARLQRVEGEKAALKTQAMLGRYMLEMRHTCNNALTSVLGNSELLLSEPGSLSAQARSQIDTIRNMALRMHEVLQRFSSLEKELSFVEQQDAREKSVKFRPAAAGV
jgi:signal transduction histidine kinase